eukprot:CAMPEP_0181086972 /NCGR_PEP_ID=MMETSP1071-20121207/6030_1 /TAXON_ID=35127 /ORGANISM="Thalassiosira sp., Strain NH16" /LENGTH=586 /DNA_ID=CAMNT_0023168841 /DNA_START=17 /DNA_END=1774 /DNA_ORIENTATION=+
MNLQANKLNNDIVPNRDSLPIAIIGGSYAGLAFANFLHRNSIPYVIFDSKSFPFTHVMGGAGFIVPSYDLIAKKLEIESSAADCVRGGVISRKDVIESLLQKVEPNLITSRRIVRIENRLGLFYLHSIKKHNSSKEQSESILGPFQFVVGADGVLSTVRTSALPRTFLIGDARWVNDRWYDFGLQRINRGADMALLDGLELGQAIAVEKTVPQMRVPSKYCAWSISRRRTRRRFALLLVILAILLVKCRGKCQVIFHNMIQTLQDVIFGDDCLNHDRQNPLMTFQFHGSWMSLDGTYAVLTPNPLFWIQLSVLIILQSLVAIILAFTIHKGIVQRRGSACSHLLCWGFILPFAITLPFYLIRFFNVRNRAVLLSTAATPTFVTFRCLEALYGFSPHSVEESLWNYCMYCSSVIEFVFDEKTKSPARASGNDVMNKGKHFAMNFLLVSLLLSFMEVHAYQPFDTHASITSVQEHRGLLRTTMRYIRPGHVGNNFLSALLTSLTVATGTAAFGFAICGLAGILTLDAFDSPMFKSTSVSDFWGRRWNRLVHGVLKRGVYKPVRKYSSKTIAALSTFIVSGILHEYILW